ncbi:MAG: CapA family protein [Chloroflexi bacterium]|nr:CapA family protein [Chloroflexota bacterium]
MILVGDWAPGQKHGELDLGPGVILANLEGPILPANHSLKPQPKSGPSLFSTNLAAPGQAVVWALANNHTMDYGLPGLETTLDLVRSTGQLAVGAGQTMALAQQPALVEDNGVPVGIISCCEAQFGTANYQQGGVAEFGPWIHQAIEQLKPKVKAIIVSVHAAVENSSWPSPRLQALYRSWILAGADVVHGHHAHIPQGLEEYQGGLIAYGLGNLLVPPQVWHTMPNTLWSLGIEVSLDSKPIKWRAFILEIKETEGKIYAEKILPHQANKYDEYIEHCNRPLKDPVLLEGLWQQVSLQAYFHHHAAYLNFADGWNKWGKKRFLGLFVKNALSKVVRLFGIQTPELAKRNYLLWYNLFACQSHYDSLRTALGVLCGEVKDLRTDEIRHLVQEMTS